MARKPKKIKDENIAVKTAKTKLNISKSEEKKLDRAAREVNFAWNEGIRFANEFAKGNKITKFEAIFYHLDEKGKRKFSEYQKYSKNEEGEWIRTDEIDKLNNDNSVSIKIQRKQEVVPGKGPDEIAVNYISGHDKTINKGE